MRLYFCRSNTFLGWAIRLLTVSRWNHVAIEASFCSVIDADYPAGVAERMVVTLQRLYEATEIVEVRCANERAAMVWLRQQLGKPYDISALFGFLFSRDWQKNDKWFCSELVAEALAQGGSPFINAAETHRVTPGDLWRSLRASALSNSCGGRDGQ